MILTRVAMTTPVQGKKEIGKTWEEETFNWKSDL